MMPCHYYESPVEITQDAVKLMLVLWPFTFLLVALLLVAFGFNFSSKFSIRHLALLIPVTVTLAMVVAVSAVLDFYIEYAGPTPEWISFVVLALIVGQLAVCVWIVRFVKVHRLVSAFALALQCWFTVICGYILISLLSNDM